MEENIKNITITEKEYNSLIEDQLMLQALEGAGVDNWDGYGFATDSFKELKEEYYK